MNRNIRHLVYFMLSGFVIIIIYLTYIQAYQREEYLTNPDNKRLLKWENNIDRGWIKDRNGQILAQTVNKDGKKLRIYPLGSITGHLVGYNSLRYGKSGVEKYFNPDLLGVTEEEILKRFLQRSSDETVKGNNLVLTIDNKIQKIAYQLMGKNKGSIVALNPKTGGILALVSKPGFDPGKLDQDWLRLNTEENSPLINRAVQGLYPPGSTLKVMTGTGIATDTKLFNQTYDCPGYLMVGNYKLNCTGVHGKVDFFQAMAKSCNAAFGTMGIQLGKDNFVNLSEGFNFGKKIPFDLPVAVSRIAATEEFTEQELAQSAIGQGRTLVTPIHMALIAAGIANQGSIMQPFLVDTVSTPDGQVIKKFKPKNWLDITNLEVANIITRGMVGVTTKGTGRAAVPRGIVVAGKTGSAQNPHGDTHAWFIGFAPADNPRVALAIILENKGLGGKVAAPIAKAIFAEALQ